jgi:hypothetical protein
MATAGMRMVRRGWLHFIGLAVGLLLSGRFLRHDLVNALIVL